MTTEIELKLEVDADDLPLIRQYPLFAEAESHVSRQVTVYYDTPETELRKLGYTLRVRSADGNYVQTIKPITDSAGLVSREEVECKVASLTPDLAQLSGHPIHAAVVNDATRLQELIRSQVVRTSWLIDEPPSRIQIDLDEGAMTAGSRTASFVELEFELRSGPLASLVVAARRLSDFAPVRLGVLTKAERGFLLARNELGKVRKADPINLRAGMSVADAFEAVVHACIKHYRTNEPIVLREIKPAALHQTRVAMRRLRSALTLFRPAIADVEFQHLREQLRWFTAQLGDARNLDVYLERDLPQHERDKLNEDREQAYARVRDAMNSRTFRRLLIDLVGWSVVGSWRQGKLSQTPIEQFAQGRLDRLWKSIESARSLSAMDEATRHEVRIQIKKLRYGFEFLHGVYARDRAYEKQFATAVEDLQESLGKLNDIATARTLGSAQPETDWLIGSPSERRHLSTAQTALQNLLSARPFWH